MHIMISQFPIKPTRVMLMVAVTVLCSGCVMKSDILMLQEDLQAVIAHQDSLAAELRVEARQTRDTLRTQGDQLFDLRGDLSRQLQQLSQILGRIEAIAGENQRGLASVRDQRANMRRAPVIPVTALSDITTSSDSSDAGNESLVGSGSNPEELYDVAKTQYDRGSLNSASRAFEQFLAEHSNNELAPDAHFFLADILTQQDRPEDAIQAFSGIQELFPAHPRVPQALYRIAEVQICLEDLDAARATLERIVNTYPDELVAMLARERLDEIG